MHYVKDYKLSENARGTSVEYSVKVCGTYVTLIQDWPDPSKPLEGFECVILPNKRDWSLARRTSNKLFP